MPTAINIRRAEPRDAAQLAALAENTFRAAFAAANTAANMQQHCATSYGSAMQLAEILDPGRETWVAEAGERMVAYVQLRLAATSPLIEGERAVEIQRFYVDASHHGTGLARELMAHVVARAAASRATVLWLGVWEKNPRALAFYAKWGFEIVGEHIFKLGEDPQRDLVMRRSV